MILALIFLQQAATAPIVHLDYSFLRYCYETRDPGCIAEKITPYDLAILNKEVTEAIITREDGDYYDPWTPFPPDRFGDCDDDAATKRAALLALGFDPKAMRFETGYADSEPHIVLVVTLDGKDYVLDRKSPDRIYPPSKRPYAWKPIAAESNNVLWSTP